MSLTQAQVAAAVRISRSVYSRIECGKLGHLSIVVATQIASVLGLDLVIRAYPGPTKLRDQPSLDRMAPVLKAAAVPIVIRTEVTLPQRPDGHPEQRAWDAMAEGDGKRTAMEMEMRLRDAQALERRIGLKLRDDPVDGFVLLLADTRTNRETLKLNPELFRWLPRLTIGVVLTALSAGRHPPSGIVFV